MPQLRVFEHPALQMQRLGYLKRLIRRVASLATTNLESLGNDLTETILKRQRVQLTLEIAEYIRARFINKYTKEIRDQTNIWLEKGGEPPSVLLELQDLYLADPKLPSQVGKLVKEDWRKYPPIGVSLGFIRSGTYSATTRSSSLLHFTTDEELQAFLEYYPKANPFFISSKQTLLLLYSFLDSDADVIIPLWQILRKKGLSTFTDRDAGDLLPQIFYNVITQYRKGRSLSIDIRNRLDSLEKSADNIAKQLNVIDYSSRSAREEHSRVRVEPYVDMGILKKPNPLKYEYSFTDAGLIWIDAISNCGKEQTIDDFLMKCFFTTAASSQSISASKVTNINEIVPRLKSAWKAISSSNGYAPIEEIALVAGIEALVDEQLIIEISTAKEALIAFQKANPYQVRFTVDRLGALAHAKFIDETGAS